MLVLSIDSVAEEVVMKNTMLMCGKLFCFAIFLIVSALIAYGQQVEGPKVFIDSVPYAKGNYTGASIISNNEIVDRFLAYCPTCRVTIQKESADYVLVFAAAQAAEARGHWNWTVYENKEGMLLKMGETIQLNNSIKDSASLIKAHWSNDKLPDQTYDADEMALVFLYRSEGIIGNVVNPIFRLDGDDLAKLTKKKYLAVEVTPGKHIFTFTTIFQVDKIEFDVKSGENLYIKYASPATIQLRKSAEGYDEIKKLKPENKKNIINQQIISDKKPLPPPGEPR